MATHLVNQGEKGNAPNKRYSIFTDILAKTWQDLATSDFFRHDQKNRPDTFHWILVR